MTTILKAVQEIEARAGGTPPPVTTAADERPATASHVLARVLVALGVGIAIGAGAIALRTSRSTPPAPPPVDVAGGPAHLAMRPPAVDAPQPYGHDGPAGRLAAATGTGGAQRPREPVAPDERPWGRVEKKTAAREAPPEAESPSLHQEPPLLHEEAPSLHQEAPSRREKAPIAAEPPPRRAGVAERPDRRVEPAAAAPRGDARASANPRAAAGARRSSAWTPAGVRVEVTAIRYADDAGERTAALRIGDRAVTLRQGESVGGLEVQLISHDAVYFRSGRDIFAVDAPR